MPLLFNFHLEHTISWVRFIQVGFKLNGSLQFLVYADNINILGGIVDTVKENVESLGMASKESGLEVNVDKTNYRSYIEFRMEDEITV